MLLSASVERCFVSRMRDFHQLGPLGQVGLVATCPSVCGCVCLMSPSHVIFSEASYWPSGHMIRSRPLIGSQVTFFFAQKPLGGGGGDAAGRDEEKKELKCFLFKFVSALLSASVERGGVSRMRGFLLMIWSNTLIYIVSIQT